MEERFHPIADLRGPQRKTALACPTPHTLPIFLNKILKIKGWTGLRYILSILQIR